MSSRIFQALKALPLIRFALMLGGGVTMTGIVTWIVALISRPGWPENVAEARVVALKLIALGALAIVGIVMVALAWGKADRIKLNIAGNEVDLDFEGEATGAPAAVAVAKEANA